MPRLRGGSGRPLATLTLPYGYPSRGSVNDHQWASIHSSPPWEDLTVATIVTNEFGSGRAIYSAASIEAVDSEAETALFVGLISSLVDGHFSHGAVAHPSVWMTTFDQRDHHRVMASFLNYQEELPPVPVPIRFWLRPPAGRRFQRLRLAPDRAVMEFALADDGTLHADLGAVELMAMVIAEYE